MQKMLISIIENIIAIIVIIVIVIIIVVVVVMNMINDSLLIFQLQPHNYKHLTNAM